MKTIETLTYLKKFNTKTVKSLRTKKIIEKKVGWSPSSNQRACISVELEHKALLWFSLQSWDGFLPFKLNF